MIEGAFQQLAHTHTHATPLSSWRSSFHPTQPTPGQPPMSLPSPANSGAMQPETSKHRHCIQLCTAIFKQEIKLLQNQDFSVFSQMKCLKFLLLSQDGCREHRQSLHAKTPTFSLGHASEPGVPQQMGHVKGAEPCNPTRCLLPLRRRGLYPQDGCP